MIEWDVLDDDRRLPIGTPKDEGPSPSRWREWWRLLLLLLVVAVGIGALMEWQTRQREQQIRADLMIVLEEEARSQAFAFRERAADLADPRSPYTWYERYVELFRTPRTLKNPPLIQEMVWDNWRVDVEVTWPDSPTSVVEQRAYRFVNGVWRRTPRTDIVLAESIREKKTTFFELRGGEEDMTAMEEDRDLRLNLEALRARVVTYWPQTWKDYFLILNIEPQELSPPVYFKDAQKLYINRPSLAQIDPFSPLPRKAQYRLAVITAVIQWLTDPEWARSLEANIGTNELPSDLAARNDWMALILILQQTEARQWALHGWERRDLRNAWREELGGVWPNPFEGPLSLNPNKATPEERKRWLAITLLIEQRVVVGGVETIGRLAQTLHNYPTEGFRISNFFEALIGGSVHDVEAIYGDYVLTPEE